MCICRRSKSQGPSVRHTWFIHKLGTLPDSCAISSCLCTSSWWLLAPVISGPFCRQWSAFISPELERRWAWVDVSVRGCGLWESLISSFPHHGREVWHLKMWLCTSPGRSGVSWMRIRDACTMMWCWRTLHLWPHWVRPSHPPQYLVLNLAHFRHRFCTLSLIAWLIGTRVNRAGLSYLFMSLPPLIVLPKNPTTVTGRCS